MGGERELKERWRSIEEELEGDDDDPDQRRLLSAKASWFSDAFDFLIKVPESRHIWCDHPNLMGPLLETFHALESESESESSSLILLWTRISHELAVCTQCVCQHHQALHSYYAHYQSDSVGPLLNTLRKLDEERVSAHLNRINAKLRANHYDPARDGPQVVSLMFEVLMFPVLFDDSSLANEFQIFLQAIDDSYQVTLSTDQQYPGVFALLFFGSSKARAIGLRLARCMGKLRLASDLEPLQPLLKKWIGFLETDVLPTSTETLRPRLQLKRADVWLGIKSLLGYLEGPAFEDGILERYPVFLNIILNHVSDDTSDFSYAVSCLKASFEMLGCKLWLRASLSPSVMRNTLLGHCFHTRDEKSHKDIFDLFIPFLQSLEALQDGEHEKQRRNILYFLLHQATRSSNFSAFTRQNASKIAILIVYRGYTMEPPSPPFECAHMWGPSLVSSLKDTTLHNSLRQPAFDLINSIIISDACALVSKRVSLSKGDSRSLFDEEDDTSFSKDTERDKSCWTEFWSQWNLTSRECSQWRCIPLLWYTAMFQVDPMNLPISFSMAIFWVLSRVSVADLSSGNERMSQSVDEWLVSHAGEISWCFKWETPNGSNDGGDGKESKNSVEVAAATCTLLLRSLKRFSMQFVVQLQKQELQRQWTWAPAMAESLVLLLVDPNDIVRQAGRAILEYVSQNRMLTAGLQFLCSSAASLSAMYLGLRYALRLVQVDPISQNFPNLHHIFFVTRKLLKEVVNPDQSPSGFHKGGPSTVRPLTEGGFLRQSGFSDPSNQLSKSMPSLVDMQSWEDFCYFLSTILWPFMVKCLEKRGIIFDEKNCEMASVRLLEVLPFVVERLCLGLSSTREDYLCENFLFPELAWLSHLANWGKSSLVVLTRHWKQCILSVLQILRGLLSTGPTQLLLALEAMVYKDKIDMEKFLEKASSCEGSALSKEAPATTRPLASLLDVDAITTQRAQPKPSSDNHLVIQEARRAATKLEANVISSAKPPTILEGRGYSKDKKPTKLSEAAAIAGKKPPLKPAELEALALASEKKQLKPPAKEELQKQLKQIVQEDDQPDPLDVALDKVRQTLIPRPPLSLTKTLPLPPKRQVVQLPMQNGSRNNTLFGNRNTSVMRFKRSNFEQWYKQILQMDYFSAVVGISKNNGHKEKDSNATLKKVPLSFQSETQYLDIFRPLVLEELKAQLRAAYVESSIEDMVCGSFSVLSVERIDEFLVVRGRPNEKEFPRNQAGCFENDLILLTKEPFRNTEQSVHVLGKVDRREKGDRDQPMILVIRFLISNEISRFIRVRKFLTERSKWFLNKVFNLTPQIREFQALSSLHDIPILPIILNPLNVNVPHTRVARPAQLHEAPLSRLDEPIRNFLTSSYNHSQLQAIDVATRKPIDGKDFELTLIQGPPGTGKTRTIVAIVSALLTSPLVQRKNSSSSSQYCPGNKQGRNPSFSSSVMRAWQDLPLAQQLMKQSFSSEGEFEGAERSLRGRILICAQSNAAVDELLSRLGEGLIGSDGQKYKPYIVRVGNQQTIHPSSLPFFIDTLVQQKLSEDMKSKKADAKSGKAEFESTSSVRARLEKVVDDIRKYEARRAKLNSNDGEDDELSKAKVVSVFRTESRDIPDDQIDAKLNQLYGQKREISSDLKIAHTNEKRLAEENRALKQKVRKQILRDAQIVLTTLSGAGGDLYSVCSEAASAGKFGIVPEHTMFDVVVIDEAAQALEPATLIPLQLLKSSKGIKCVMVGDPKQLPATVISDVASKFSYECSMFERLQRAGHPVIMLTQQYRMHPDISRFPSLHFYDGNLLNGTHMEDRFAPFHNIKCLGPYMFFDVNDGQERFAGSQSLRNESEAEAATEILKFLNKRYPSELPCKKIGIITPYKSQLSLLRSKFNSILGPDAVTEMELNTVDGFQGREVDILLLSTVRANSSSSSDESGHIRTGTGGIGFVADVRRMNVALTRAKFSLWIFGNARTLQVNPHWTALMQDARQRNLFVSISRPYSFQELLPDSMGKDIIMNCKVKRFGSSMPGREREPRSGVEQFGSSKQMPMPGREREPRSGVKRFGSGMQMQMPGREREPRSGVKQLGSSMQMPMLGMESEARSGVKRFGSSMQMPMPGMESEARSGVKRFGSSMHMSMPGIESELRSGAGVLMKRANENEVAVRGPGGSRNGSERSRADSKAIASGSKGRSENVGVGKRGLGELVEDAKEAAKKLCDPGECSGADFGSSKQIQTDAGHSLTREKRRVMPMPMPTPKTRGSKGPVAPSGSEKKKGGAEEAGERKKGKAAKSGVGVGVGSVLNSARKRQREEVGSLLSSALIPSKKKSL